jgi:GNAT superfamily N-acetyltransferase
MIVQDVGEVVMIHQRAFPTFFLSFLGPGFLFELYSAVASDVARIAFVSHRAGELVGFVAGTVEPASFYRRLLRRRWWRFVVASLWPALRRPSTVPRLLRALRKPSESCKRVDHAELMSVAVSPKAQGTGVGKLLVEAFVAEARRRNAKAVYLTTDGVGNEAANVFYRRLGFHCSRTFLTPEGRSMNEYEIIFDAPTWVGVALAVTQQEIT